MIDPTTDPTPSPPLPHRPGEEPARDAPVESAVECRAGVRVRRITRGRRRRTLPRRVRPAPLSSSGDTPQGDAHEERSREALLPTPVICAALVAGITGPPEPSTRAELRAQAGQEPGLALRLAMVLACIRQFDLAELGYSGFLAFCRERVDWGQAWTRALVRLVTSPLEEVKAAAMAGLLPLRVAVRAPGRVTRQEQAEWLTGQLPEEPRRQQPRRGFLDADAEAVDRARELARACTAPGATLARLDACILRHWREKIPGKALEEGRAVPSPPPRQAPDFGSCGTSAVGGGAPAEALLGPWKAPADLGEALTQLEAVQSARRSRLASMSRAFARLSAAELQRAGFASHAEFAEEALGWSRRTAQRRRRLGAALLRHPQLDRALRDGLAPSAAARIGAMASGDPALCDRWLAVARHLGRQELDRALENGGERLEDYERAVRIARRNASEILGPRGPAAAPSGTLAVVRVGDESADPGAPCAGTAPTDPSGDHSVAIRVALPHPPPRPPAVVTGHPDLAEAARWFLENNPLPRHTGFAASKCHARYRCQNPDCGRLTLRIAAHHVHWRRHGGADDLANAVALCPSCHLRGVHTADERIRVTRVLVEGLEALFWEYPDRAPVLLFREPPPGGGRRRGVSVA